MNMYVKFTSQALPLLHILDDKYDITIGLLLEMKKMIRFAKKRNYGRISKREIKRFFW